MRRSDTLARRLGVGIGVIGGFFLGYALVRLSGISHQGWVLISLTTMEGLILGYLGTPYLLGGWRDFNKRLTSTPLPDLLSGLLCMIVGLVIAVLIGVFLRDLIAPYGVALSFVLAILPCLAPPSASRAALSSPPSFSEASKRRRATASTLSSSTPRSSSTAGSSTSPRPASSTCP